MLDQNSKRQILEKILQSEEFVNSTRYKDLLSYLVDAHIENKAIKETTIAIDLFHKDQTFSPSEDTIVRVTIGNLRKKLDHFYLTDGAEDTIRLDLPKGKYDLLFYTVQLDKKFYWSSKRKYFFYIQSVLLFLALFFLIYVFIENKSIKDRFYTISEDNPFWSEFLNSDKPTLIVFGDYFFMYEYHNGRRIFVRDTRINSKEEFETKIKPFNDRLNPLEFTYLTSGLTFSLIEILPIFNIANQKIQVKLSSQLEWSDFDRANIIYIGTAKALYIINGLLPHFNINFDLGEEYLLNQLNDSGKVINSFELPRNKMDEFMKDHAFIGKIKGPGNNTFLMIVSGDDVGLVQALKTLSSLELRENIEQKFKDIVFRNPFYFDMIIKTEGFRRTGFNTDVIYFKENTSHIK